MFKKLIIMTVAVGALGVVSTLAEARKAAECQPPNCNEGAKAAKTHSPPSDRSLIDPNYRKTQGGILDPNIRKTQGSAIDPNYKKKKAKAGYDFKAQKKI